MSDFKERLAKLMKERNFNSSTLGEALGYKSTSTVLKWISGKGMPDLHKIQDLAKTLDVDPAYLLFGTQPPKQYATEQKLGQFLEPNTPYGISPEELIEFYKWKANKATEEAQRANLQVERLKSTEVDAK
ncbi:helix-turn-helix domain-containing protein [Lacihabitans soyangensis]|uniref:XRE family transcriptional regulator n=1 Tax=Lacihabitans soyangensis TaxID=869394 RepID=A0AAE3H588_9BACT|nr:helix-turn-helix transcriptional regulator [Lacihabitans soyangensis]MCP9765167.1 XRE family transcriptional regulator [Lacihabitans soyangensis]